MDQATRNRLRNVVTQCRRLLEQAVSDELQGKFGIYPSGKKDAVQIDDEARMTHLEPEDLGHRRDLLAHLDHIQAFGSSPRSALEQLVREIAFTHLNRLCAYKMMETREVYVAGEKFREAVGRGTDSRGFKFYLADHPEDERLSSTGKQDVAYRRYLDWLGGRLSREIGVLFSPTDPANRLYPPQRVLDEVLGLINGTDLAGIWSEDEAIGWVYQYFTPKELRDEARKASQAPRNSYELAFRNQFFTPRYVVEFLADNTLGRIWYEMLKGKTRLKDECRSMVRRPGEVFFAAKAGEPDSPVMAMKDLILGGTEETFPPFRVGEAQRLIELAHTVDGYERHPIENASDPNWWPWATSRQFERSEDLSGFPTQDLLDVLFIHARGHYMTGGYGDLEPVCYRIGDEIRRRCLEGRKEDTTQVPLHRAVTAIPHRPKKDPREIRILDPACGSGHFLLYCFALLLVIYEEAYDDPDLGPALHADYPTVDDLRRAVPGLILEHNLHGIDIDLRATQIAALALWLRCQRAYGEMGLKKDRPPITRSNIVCAEPMPGEEALLDEFLTTMREDRLEALIRRSMDVSEGGRVRATKAMADSLAGLVRTVWEKMRLAGEAGSLLRIEEELQEAIRRGQEEWEERLPLFRYTEYGLADGPKEELVRFVPGDVEGDRVTFWDRAEGLVRKALDEFVEFASDGGRLQRSLFVEDARQGLGFVDVCRQRFDVVLMNPPFGGASKPSKAYVERAYPRTKNDMYAAFVERGLLRLEPGGRLGAITSRTGFFLTSFQKWREEVLLGEARPSIFADLGHGVLDTAMVETAAYVVERRAESAPPTPTPFLRLLTLYDKPAALAATIDCLRAGRSCSESHVVEPESFQQVPGAPFAYWVSNRVLNLWTSQRTLGRTSVHVCSTNPLNDDFRYFRLWWEVCPRAIGRNNGWAGLSKGGEFARYYSDVHLLAAWDEVEQTYRGFTGTVNRPLKRPASLEWFFKAGLTWSRRTTSSLSLRVLPQGCIFADKGPALFSLVDQPWFLAGLMNSRPFGALVEIQLASADAAARSYEVGIIQRTPVPDLSQVQQTKLGEFAHASVDLKRSLDTSNEISHLFQLPAAVQVLGVTLAERVASWQAREADTERQLAEFQREIDDIAFRLYGIDGEDRRAIEAGASTRPTADNEDEAIEEDEDTDAEMATDARALVVALVSYAVGAVIGRWDLRYATGERTPPDLPDPFAPLPVCSPGMFQGPDGLPSSSPPEGYPLRIDADGLLVDDPDHPDDILRRVREVLELIWKDCADTIEREACDLLGVADLRDYFRRPGKGGFWDDHIARYSRSRRKAPIYWLLQSSKKNYALWLYYHRFDRDLLFKALQNYVLPRIAREQNRVEELRAQKGGLSPDARGSKKIDKDIDRQEALVSELRDFEDTLRRAAGLYLDPDLNDGVVLNIAPLRELVPWKEARKYWDELLDGKYEWSSIGKQLREKGVVP